MKNENTWKIGNCIVFLCDDGGYGWAENIHLERVEHDGEPFSGRKSNIYGSASVNTDNDVLILWSYNLESEYKELPRDLPLWDRTKYYQVIFDIGESPILFCETNERVPIELAERIITSINEGLRKDLEKYLKTIKEA